MGKFKKYLNENEDLLQQINDMLDELSEEEIDELGYILYFEFFDVDEEAEEDMAPFTMEDVKSMIKSLGVDFYEEIFYLLLPEDLEDDDDLSDAEDVHGVEPSEQVAEGEELDEALSRVMKKKNMNRKKRKFMGNTKADMRKTKVARKKQARIDRPARKRAYRANKMKIKSYQKSYRKAIEKGKHIVKIRKQA